ncbi:hypothetical protein B0A48_03297 [Cryoendolithus antarcticus]|uniref:Uncharacterized protein n=1 Tax=Cryoendolithus antarcticus TaxID=1507870 RepID=A0A1V8TJL1_9PEZI|nr:hypothetical protein B0A48_03297 [Cryoendolithus antarcticus]
MPPIKNRPGRITRPKYAKAATGERAHRVQKKSRITVELNAPKDIKVPAGGLVVRAQRKADGPIRRSEAQHPASSTKNGTKNDPIVLDIETATQGDPNHIASDNVALGSLSDLDSLCPGPPPVIVSRAHQSPQSILHRLLPELRNIVYDLLNPALGTVRKRNHIDVRFTNVQPPLNPDDKISPEHAPIYLAAALPLLASEIYSTYLSSQYIDIQVYSDLLISPGESLPTSVACRGGRFGLGNLVLEADSWIYRVDPAVVCIRHITLRVAEKGGTSICTFSIDVGRSREGGQMEARSSRTGPTDKGRLSDLSAMTKMAHARVEKCTARPDFGGFKLAEIEDIAKSFRSGKLAKADIDSWSVGRLRGGCKTYTFRGGREIVEVKAAKKTG